MGRQRNNPQMKEKEESPEKDLNEIQTSNLSTEFKVMVIRMRKELTGNYISMKKDIKTMNKNQVDMKTTISEIKNTLEGINSRLDEAEDQIRELEDNITVTTQGKHQKEKGIKSNEESLRQGCQTHFHQGPHQPCSCLQKAEYSFRTV